MRLKPFEIRAGVTRDQRSVFVKRELANINQGRGEGVGTVRVTACSVRAVGDLSVSDCGIGIIFCGFVS